MNFWTFGNEHPIAAVLIVFLGVGGIVELVKAITGVLKK